MEDETSKKEGATCTIEDEISSKKERATAKRLFTMASNRVTKGINEKIDIAILHERFQKVKLHGTTSYRSTQRICA